MPLNRSSILRIERGTAIIHAELQTRNRFTPDFAKFLLRSNGVCKQVRANTLDRIGESGKDQGLYGYDSAHGFWKEQTDNPPKFAREYVDEWSTSTSVAGPGADGGRTRGMMRTRVNNALNTMGDPNVLQDMVNLCQQLNEQTDNSDAAEWAALGSFRSFVAWGIDNGYWAGNKDLLWIPTELQSGVRQGVYSARIAQGMTNTLNQWTWWITDQEGKETGFLGTSEELAEYLNTLNADSMDTETVDLADLMLGYSDPEPVPYFDVELLTAGDGSEDDEFADAAPGISDDLLGRVMASDVTNDVVAIPRPIARRINQLCQELQGLLSIYL